MRFVIPLAIIIGLTASGIALAEGLARDGKGDAQTRAVAEVDLRAKIDKLGYDVRRLREEGRHFEAQIVDRASGGAVEATFDKSGELVRAKLAEDSGEGCEGNESREHHTVRKSDERRARADAARDPSSQACEVR